MRRIRLSILSALLTALTLPITAQDLVAPGSGGPSTTAPIAIVDQVGGLQYGVRPNYVTSDGSGTHQTTPGVDQFGLDHDGVGEMLFADEFGSTFRCTGSLLWTGRHVLTAAHCLTDGSGNQTVQAVNFFIDDPDGTIVRTTTAIDLHPNWDGNIFNGHDVAVLTLNAPVNDSDVPLYNVNRTVGNEFGVPTVKVGYGQAGDGPTGSSLVSGTKRIGLNEWEDDGLGTAPGTDNATGLPINNNQTQLTYDFDSNFRNRTDLTGNDSDHDAFDFFFGLSDLGFGDDEVNAAPGDSGGASFIDVNGEMVIAGVTSYGLRVERNNGDTSDIDSPSTPNSTWGEFAVDTRVADPSVLAFIDLVVPEPGTAMLLTPLMTLVIRRRRMAA
jgi:hypothetical protein